MARYNFKEHPFEQKYIVSVKVYYNSNKTIAKYEVIEYFGIDD